MLIADWGRPARRPFCWLMGMINKFFPRLKFNREGDIRFKYLARLSMPDGVIGLKCELGWRSDE